jgi:hypothetical protein
MNRLLHFFAKNCKICQKFKSFRFHNVAQIMFFTIFCSFFSSFLVQENCTDFDTSKKSHCLNQSYKNCHFCLKTQNLKELIFAFFIFAKIFVISSCHVFIIFVISSSFLVEGGCLCGATTLSITTFSIVSLCLMALCRVALCNYAECNSAKYCYAECNNAKLCNSECRYAECRGAVCVA